MIALNRSADGPTLFQPGQLVYHIRYRYRGVVVEFDESCRADENWYQGNQTQPDRSQPWYHVLVDQSATCTYVAAENLIVDDSGRPVSHPLLPRFFSDFVDGQYVRNDEPWPWM